MTAEDVVIIGAGVAGLTAAKFISLAGISPLVLESGKTVCKKACGEGVHAKTVDGMDFFNIYDSKKGFLRLLLAVFRLIGQQRMPISQFIPHALDW